MQIEIEPGLHMNLAGTGQLQTKCLVRQQRSEARNVGKVEIEVEVRLDALRELQIKLQDGIVVSQIDESGRFISGENVAVVLIGRVVRRVDQRKRDVEVRRVGVQAVPLQPGKCARR